MRRLLRWNNQRGQGLAELAIVIPGLLLLALGINAILILVDEHSQLQQAVERGALDAARDPGPTCPEQVADNGVIQVLTDKNGKTPAANTLTILVDCTGGGSTGDFTRGGLVTVRARLRVDNTFLIQWGQVYVSAVAVQVIEPYRSRPGG